MEVDSGWDDAQSISPSVMGFLASGKKISDAITFGPKFCELFHSFCAENELVIDIHRHLFALIIEHLIAFVRWVRRDEHQVAEVNNLLFNCDYLRPETRNGVIMVIIYMFASIKSTVLPNADMFTVLVHDEYGLGIANRFSLKIYNDPFCFLAFLKFAVSALIDCGTLPENDRQNTVIKVSKARTEDVVEREFFLKIQREILAALAENDVPKAKRIVEYIANYCQLNKREIVRGKQFSMCYRKLQTWNAEQADSVPATNDSTTISAPAITAAPGVIVVPSDVAGPTAASSSVTSTITAIPPVNSNTNISIATLRETERETAIATLNPPHKRRCAVAFAEDAHDADTTTNTQTTHTTPTQTLTLPHMSHTLTHGVQGLRYTRVGRATWTISRFAIFDLSSLLATIRSNTHYNRTLFLVDSNNNSSDNAILQPNTHYSLAPKKYYSDNTHYNNQNNNSTSNDSSNNNNNNTHTHTPAHALSRSLGIQTLRNAFISAQALVTDWDAEDTQLPLYWALLQSSSSRDLPAIWKNEISSANTLNAVTAAAVRTSEKDRERGFIAIEVDQRMIICIRRVIVHSESSAFPASFSSDDDGEDKEDREDAPDNDGNDSSNNKKKKDHKRRRAPHHTAHVHKEEELWCHIYAEDLAETDAAQSLGEYLLSLFPQLCTRLSASLFARTIIKYRATPLLQSAFLPPLHTQRDTQTHTEAMETLGTLSQRVGDLLCKLSPHQVCHNFTLEVL